MVLLKKKKKANKKPPKLTFMLVERYCIDSSQVCSALPAEGAEHRIKQIKQCYFFPSLPCQNASDLRQRRGGEVKTILVLPLLQHSSFGEGIPWYDLACWHLRSDLVCYQQRRLIE